LGSDHLVYTFITVFQPANPYPPLAMKLRNIQPNKRNIHLNYVLLCSHAQLVAVKIRVVFLQTSRSRWLHVNIGMFKTLRVFAPSSSEFIPFLTCHHSITNFEINAFLNQDSYRLLKFVSDLVSYFDTGCFCFTSQLPSARDSGCRPSL
jgi:hypothetical protein